MRDLKKTVLITEDDDSLREIYELVLTEEGYKVLTAKNGEEGLFLLKNNHIDLVLSDMRMPKMDGVNFVREARKFGINTPFVLITGFAEYCDKEMSFLGVKEVLQKPLNYERLTTAIHNKLQEARQY